MRAVLDRNRGGAVLDDDAAIAIAIVVIVVVLIVFSSPFEGDDHGFVAFEPLIVAADIDAYPRERLSEAEPHVVRQALVVVVFPRRAGDREPDPHGIKRVAADPPDDELAAVGGRFARGVVRRFDGNDDLGERGGGKRQQRESAERAGKAPGGGAVRGAKTSSRYGSELVLHVLYSPFGTLALSSPRPIFAFVLRSLDEAAVLRKLY